MKPPTDFVCLGSWAHCASETEHLDPKKKKRTLILENSFFFSYRLLPARFQRFFCSLRNVSPFPQPFKKSPGVCRLRVLGPRISTLCPSLSMAYFSKNESWLIFLPPPKIELVFIPPSLLIGEYQSTTFSFDRTHFCGKGNFLFHIFSDMTE